MDLNHCQMATEQAHSAPQETPTLMQYTHTQKSDTHDCESPCSVLSGPQFPHLQTLAIETIAEPAQEGIKAMWALLGLQQRDDCHEQPSSPV